MILWWVFKLSERLDVDRTHYMCALPGKYWCIELPFGTLDRLTFQRREVSSHVQVTVINCTVAVLIVGFAKSRQVACASAEQSCVGSDRNLVDPASSHMLVSKIKPCMSQYKLLYGETANGSLKQL